MKIHTKFNKKYNGGWAALRYICFSNITIAINIYIPFNSTRERDFNYFSLEMYRDSTYHIIKKMKRN